MVPGGDIEEKRCIGHAPAQGTNVAEVIPTKQSLGHRRHEAEGRLDAEAARQCRRDADRTTGVRPGRQRHHSPHHPPARPPLPAPPPPPPPPLDPPGVSAGAHGFPVVPKSSFVVKAVYPNSGAFVLPTTIAPAARSRATWTSSAAGQRSAKARE